MTTSTKALYYFGCIKEPGHYLWESERMGCYPSTIKIPGANTTILGYLDGTFTPGGNQTEGIYNDCTIPPLRIVSWWDRSIDKRIGSSSTLIGFGYSNAEEMLDDATKQFPSVMARQPRPKPLITQ